MKDWQTLIRSALALLLLACSSETSTNTQETGGKTSWLSRCTMDSDCEGGVCAGGACTSACFGDTDCTGHGSEVACFAGSSNTVSDCISTQSREVCLPACGATAECATFGDDFICSDGVCQPSAARCADGLPGGDDESRPEPEPTDEAELDDASADDDSSSDDDAPVTDDDFATDDDGAADDVSDDDVGDDDFATDDDGAVDDVSEDDLAADDDGESATGDGGSTSNGDGGSNGGDTDAGDGSSEGSDAGTVLCGGDVCGPDQFCCGPPECGACVPLLTQGPECPETCPSTGGEVRLPECPSEITESCDGALCQEGNAGRCLACPEGQVCVQVDFSCGPGGGRSAQCVPDPCADQALDCSCAADLCSVEGVPLYCTTRDQTDPTVGADGDPFVACTGGGVCASPDTPIATADGERRIADIRIGDLVYSQDSEGIGLVPVLRLGRTPVYEHSVVRLVLDDGAVLEISGPHPTADGRWLRDLRSGDELDGRRVLTSEWIPYTHEFTYDILPASGTGSYVANGVWMGTTLRP